MAQEFKFQVGLVDGISPETAKIADALGTLSGNFKGLNQAIKSLNTGLTSEHSAALRAAQGVEALGRAQTEVGGAAGVFHRINGAISTTFEPLTQANEHAAKLGKTLGEVGEASGVSKLGEVANSLAGPLTALAGLASVTGMVENVKATAEWGKSLKLAAQSTGFNVGDLSALQFQAQQLGVSSDTVNTSLGHFNKTIADAASGRNQQAAVLFSRLGVSLRDANGHLRTGIEPWLQFVQAIKDQGNAAVQASDASTVLGRGYEDLMPVLQQGAQGFKDMRTEAQKTGNYLNDQGAEAATDAADAWDDLDNATKGLSRTLGITLAPALAKVVGGLADFVSNNPKTTQAIVEIGGALAGLAGSLWILTTIGGVLGKIGGGVAWAARGLGAIGLDAVLPEAALAGGAGYVGYKITQSLMGSGPPRATIPQPGMMPLAGIGNEVAPGWWFLKPGQTAADAARNAAAIGAAGRGDPGANSHPGMTEAAPGWWFRSPGQTGGNIAGGGALNGAAALAAPVPFVPPVPPPKPPPPAKAEITVNFTNLPAGTRVSTQSQGANVQTSVGYNYPAAAIDGMP